MKTVRLGRSGLEVSSVCLGTMSFGKTTDERPWVVGLDEARPMFRAAWEGGITFYDTANVYAEGTSEEVTGQALWDIAPRHEVVLATKVFGRMRPGPNGQGLSRAAILHEVDQSLRRLRTDYVDLYQIHRHDPFTPYEETMQALHDVVRAGKARYVGASSMWAWQFAKYQEAARQNGLTPFVSMQDELSLVYREEEREMLPLCREGGIGVIPWSPLGGGKLTRPWGERTSRSTTDRYNKSMYDEDAPDEQAVVQATADLARSRGVSMAQVALAWVMRQPGVTAPIVGASRPGHVEDALAAAALELTDDEARALETPYRPHAVRGFS